MKTVSGRVISSKPISLSKAASVLSTFVSADRGASQAVSAYLSRASAAFNELVQFHKELKARRSERKHKKFLSEASFDNGNLTDTNRRGDGYAIEGARILNLEEDEERSQGYHSENFDGGDFDGEGRKRKRKKKRESEDGGYVRIDEEKSIERKKRKKGEIEDEELGDSEERHSEKRKRRKKHI